MVLINETEIYCYKYIFLILLNYKINLEIFNKLNLKNKNKITK